MKIQSSLLILAAIAGSATAANTRKRVFKIYSREEIQAAEATRSLQKEKDQGGGNIKGEPPVEPVPVVQSMSMSMTLSPSGSPVLEETITTPTAMSMMTKCSFCDGELFDASTPLIQGQTCGTVHAAATMLDATDENCARAKLAEEICCPSEVVTTTYATMSMPITTEAAVAGTDATVATTEVATTPPAEGVPAPAPTEGVMGAPSGAMTMETTFAALTVAGAMLLV
ncbi:hypothetical protein ACHAWT_008698 [Skeletonema menzelii]